MVGESVTWISRSTRKPVGFTPEGALFILKSNWLAPATNPLVSVNAARPPKPGLVMPVLRPFTRISMPVLSTPQAPTTFNWLTS